MKNKAHQPRGLHEFALYYNDLATLQISEHAMIIDHDDLFHRLKHVLRLQKNDHCILFNQHEHAIFELDRFEGKKKVIGFVRSKKTNTILQPRITFIVPLLKIDALTDAIYSCAEVGINTVQLVTTQKTQTVYTEKLLDKLQRTAIAAAEQSKMFAFPTILPPLPLSDVLAQNYQGVRCYFDVGGVPFDVWYKPINKDEQYYLLVGPEGDLTDHEKKDVQKAGFTTCLLTPTVLRSVRSISIISGLFRL